MDMDYFRKLVVAEIEYHQRRIQQIDKTLGGVCSLDPEELSETEPESDVSDADDDESER